MIPEVDALVVSNLLLMVDKTKVLEATIGSIEIEEFIARKRAAIFKNVEVPTDVVEVQVGFLFRNWIKLQTVTLIVRGSFEHKLSLFYMPDVQFVTSIAINQLNMSSLLKTISC